jgi:hypothetical protein
VYYNGDPLSFGDGCCPSRLLRNFAGRALRQGADGGLDLTKAHPIIRRELIGNCYGLIQFTESDAT